MKSKIYQGSNKILYKTDESPTVILSFIDDLILDNKVKVTIPGKGVINNILSSFIMGKLDSIGIENHFLQKLNMREQLVQLLEIIPIQVSVTNVAGARYVSQFGIEEGYVFENPIIDYKVKNRDLSFPIINEHQIINFGWLTNQELKQIKSVALRVYDFLTGLFSAVDIRLVEATLEFGRVFNGDQFIIMLADEITPDNCRLWDMHNNTKLGFEAIDHNLNTSVESYEKIINRFNIQN